MRASDVDVEPVPPFATAIAVPFQVPVAIVPTDVRDDPVTPEPNVVPERTDVPLILSSFVEARLMCSDDVQESVASIQLRVLSVSPLRVIPPPSAPASVGVVTEPSVKFLSSTVISVELIVVVVPLTVRSPERTKDVPVAAPMFGVTSVGVLAKTSAPVPVSSEIIPASSDEDVAESTFSLSVVTTRVFVLGMLVPLIESAVATPSAGVVSVGLVRVLFVRVCVFVVPTTAPVAPCDSVAPV